PADELVDLGRVADVAAHPECPDPVLAREALGDDLAALRSAGAEDEVGAELGKRLGELKADAAAAARDDRHPAGEVEEVADVHLESVLPGGVICPATVARTWRTLDH